MKNMDEFFDWKLYVKQEVKTMKWRFYGWINGIGWFFFIGNKINVII